MKFYLRDSNKYMDVSMKTWENGQWTPDFFSDMETSVPSMFKREDGGDAYLVTSAEFRQIVEWWEEECRCMRDGETGDMMVDYSECPSDTHLFVEEIA